MSLSTTKSEPQSPGAKTQERTCEACGRNFEATVGVRGRPQVYCTKGGTCKRIMQLLSWLQDSMVAEDFKPTKERARMIRAQLWQMGNAIHTHETPKKR